MNEEETTFDEGSPKTPRIVKAVCKLRGHHWREIFTPDENSQSYAALVCIRCGHNAWRTR